LFNYLAKKFNLVRLLRKQSTQNANGKKQSGLKISPHLKQNLETLKKTFKESNDFVIREFSFGSKEEPINVALVYIEGLVAKTSINDDIMKPLMYDSSFAGFINTYQPNDIIAFIDERLLSMADSIKVSNLEEVVEGCLDGHTILLVEGETQALSISNQGWERRSISEPQGEVVVRGPREGFTETLRINTSLLRRKIHNPDLVLEMLKVGQKTRTNVCIAYIAGIADDGVVQEVKNRIEDIKTDAILESGYIEQFIEDAPFSPFATIGNSEKPDVVAAKLLEGRVAILVDGSPVVLTVPFLFIEGFQSAEDYYSRPYYSSLVRILRYMGFLFSLYGPGFFVAVVAFHQELIPDALIITISSAMEGTPFPVALEAIGMGIVFEILREAGVRLPKAVGQSVSIVGALVLGDAVVSAGFVSSTMVIVVAFTAIASFVVTSHSDAESIIRFVMTLLGSALGLFGITIGTIGILIHLSALRSFGSPYLSPLAPISWLDLKDTFLRFPLWAMITRPKTIGWNNYQRESLDLIPKPPQKKKDK
jgi:spore germination protein KA